MNEPRVPLNNKNWNDIDIFLFSNGQECSPPRKYHLKSAELEFWESTIHYLARTQFGHMNSNIELYTLGGQKVESPLELVDAASYVAVKPPEAFIPAGYERYLIKASRSWEKRQEKLTNSDATGEMQLIKEVSKSAVDELKANETANIQNPKNITEMNDILNTNNTIASRQRKENERSFEGKQKEYKPFLIRKSVENKIIKKNTSQISNNNMKADSILSKKRNVKSSSSRRQSVITKSDKNNKTNIFNKEKIQPNTTKISEELDIKEIIVLSKPNQFDGNLSHEVSEMGSDRKISSDVYKNPDSEVQSIYIEVDRKIIPREYMTKEKKSHELQKIDELNDELVSQRVHKAISVQSITFSTKNYGPEVTLSSKAKELNIKLNIKVRDDRESTATERSGRLGKCKSYTALLTAEQGSQANISMNLNEEDFKYENSSLRRKSTFGDKAYLCSDDAKVIVVNCICGLSEAYNINNKSKENYIILVPSTLADKNLESFRSIPDHNHSADKECFTSRHSILNPETWHLKSNPVSKENSQTTIKHKVSICPDTPIKISAETPPNLKKHIINAILNKKVDQFTQTIWCNMLASKQVDKNLKCLLNIYLPGFVHVYLSEYCLNCELFNPRVRHA